METDTESESDEDMEMEEPLVFEVNEIDLEYEFDAARWHDFTREELEIESRVAELWFESAQSYPPSPFTRKLLMIEEVSDDTTEPSSSKSEDGEVTADVMESDREIREKPDDVNETGNVVRSEVFTFIHGGSLKKDPNQSLHKGPTFSNRIHTDKLKCQPKSSTRPIPRSSTLMKPTASQLAKQDSVRHRVQVAHIKEKSLFPSSGSEIQASKRQKLDGGLLHKVAATTQEMSFVHKAVKKITVPQEPDFATSHRANRIRHRSDATLEQDSTSVYRFKARPFNRKIFEAPSLPIRKKSTPKLPEFQEFHLKTSERAMQHSSVVSTGSHHYHKGLDKPDTTAFLDGVNREPRRPRAVDIPKDDDRKHLLKAPPLDNKMVSSRRDIGIFRKSKRETTVPLPTDLFSKLSIKSELQPNNGSRLRFPQPEQVKGSKENRLNSFLGQAGNERSSSVTGKQRGLWTTRRSLGIR